jgi:CheY-like chemotaxis protein
MDAEVAKNGAEAVNLLNSGKPFDFVLSDLQMPVMDGEELARQIRGSRKSYANVPMLIQTGKLDPEEVKISQGSNVKMVSKGLEPNDLLIAMANELVSDGAMTAFDVQAVKEVSNAKLDYVEDEDIKELKASTDLNSIIDAVTRIKNKYLISSMAHNQLVTLEFILEEILKKRKDMASHFSDEVGLTPENAASPGVRSAADLRVEMGSRIIWDNSNSWIDGKVSMGLLLLALSVFGGAVYLYHYPITLLNGKIKLGLSTNVRDKFYWEGRLALLKRNVNMSDPFFKAREILNDMINHQAELPAGMLDQAKADYWQFQLNLLKKNVDMSDPLFKARQILNEMIDHQAELPPGMLDQAKVYYWQYKFNIFRKNKDKGDIFGIAEGILNDMKEHQNELPSGMLNEANQYGKNTDKSMNITPGGIDLNSANLNLQIKRDGKGIPLPIAQQDLGDIKIDGLVPVIVDIRPAVNSSLMSELQVSGA